MKKKTANMKVWYEQGDVMLKKIDKLPEGLEKLSTKVLQESEVTGHHHHFKPTADVAVYQTKPDLLNPSSSLKTITPNLGKYIEVGTNGDVYLYHGKGFDESPAIQGRGDHDAFKIEPGIYEVDIVREYDYDKNESTRVVD